MGDTPMDAYATPVAGSGPGSMLDETPTGVPLKKTDIGTQVLDFDRMTPEQQQ